MQIKKSDRPNHTVYRYGEVRKWQATCRACACLVRGNFSPNTLYLCSRKFALQIFREIAIVRLMPSIRRNFLNGRNESVLENFGLNLF